MGAAELDFRAGVDSAVHNDRYFFWFCDKDVFQ